VATRCPASGLLVWALDAPTPLIRRLGRMHEVKITTHLKSFTCWVRVGGVRTLKNLTSNY